MKEAHGTRSSRSLESSSKVNVCPGQESGEGSESLASCELDRGEGRAENGWSQRSVACDCWDTSPPPVCATACDCPSRCLYASKLLRDQVSTFGPCVMVVRLYSTHLCRFPRTNTRSHGAGCPGHILTSSRLASLNTAHTNLIEP